MDEKNLTICKKISEIPSKNTCYNVVAVNNKNSSICEEISDERQK